MLRLTSNDGSAFVFHKRQFPLMIGRSPCADVSVDNRFASRAHCELALIDGDVVARDLFSRHGTFLNGHPILEKVLHSGDQLQIGLTTLTVQILPDTVAGGTQAPRRTAKHTS